LNQAAEYGHFEVVKFLVDKGAKGLDGAYYLAGRYGYKEIADFLKSRGAK